jgi:hypothetical protein
MRVWLCAISFFLVVSDAMTATFLLFVSRSTCLPAFSRVTLMHALASTTLLQFLRSAAKRGSNVGAEFRLRVSGESARDILFFVPPPIRSFDELFLLQIPKTICSSLHITP